MSWFTKLERNGQDLYPHLIEASEDPEIYEQDPVRFEMMKESGYFVTESSGHFSENEGRGLTFLQFLKYLLS